VLCIQRAEHEKEYVSLKWEFPVGKVEAGESREEALVREIEEELIVEIHELQYLMNVEHSYPDFHLTMHAYTCTLKAREVELREHIGLKWLAVEELDQLDWAEADVPLVEY
jgi:8-oxo-dGTP diphosphatase